MSRVNWSETPLSLSAAHIPHSTHTFHPPRCIVDEREVAEVVTVVERGHRALAVDDDVDRASEDDVPGLALVTLVEHCRQRQGRGVSYGPVLVTLVMTGTGL